MKKNHGFTLIELLITIAIVAILAVVAVPTYTQYTKKAYFTEVINATGPFKLGVELCYHQTSALTNCNAGSNGVPSAAAASGNVASVSVAGGTITATGGGTKVSGITYILTPGVTNNVVLWTVSGTCQAQGMC